MYSPRQADDKLQWALRRVVITGGGYSYRRPDGTDVVALASLGA